MYLPDRQPRYSPIELQREQLPSIHEQGGLGTKGWERVRELRTDSFHARRKSLRTRTRTGNSLAETKIDTYAREILDGKIDDRDFTHRKYLDRTDWLESFDVVQDFPLQPQPVVNNFKKISIE